MQSQPLAHNPDMKANCTVFEKLFSSDATQTDGVLNTLPKQTPNLQAETTSRLLKQTLSKSNIISLLTSFIKL